MIERSYDEQWKEIQRTHYDVEGGDYTWYMLPSKQSEYADKGWTITAKTPGRYTETVNVKFPVDSENAVKHEKDPVVYADPLFQQVITDVNFTLPKAFEVDQDLTHCLVLAVRSRLLPIIVMAQWLMCPVCTLKLTARRFMSDPLETVSTPL